MPNVFFFKSGITTAWPPEYRELYICVRQYCYLMEDLHQINDNLLKKTLNINLYISVFISLRYF